MANCTANFKSGDNSYLSNISLPQKRLDQLLQSSNALRERIRGYLREKKVGNPRFYRQGSYIHRTLIRPLSEDYDLDDGVYLDLTEFTSTPSPATIHDWIHTAVEDHTQTPPTDKEACVRANFKDGFHVDLPAYNAIKNTQEGSEEYYLARKTKGWELSDPRAMTTWFTNMVGVHSEQLRRLVKYAKSWADYCDTNKNTNSPNGLTLTIIVSEQCCSDTRDDIAFLETLKSIKGRLSMNYDIWKPYEPSENMADYLSASQREQFLVELESFCSNGQRAIEEKSRKYSALIWRDILGERFPVFDDDDESSTQAKRIGTVAVLGADHRSAKRWDI